MKNYIKRLHVWSLHWATTKWGLLALFLCAFADASFLPLPTPMFILTLTLLNVTKAYKYALIGTFGLLCGAIAGYFVGHFAWLNDHGDFTGLAQFMFNQIPGFSEIAYNNIHALFEKWDLWILLFASFMPLPYNIFSISSGVFDVNPLMFILATLIGQGIRFYLMAFLIVKMGPEVKKLFEFKLKPVAIFITACIAIVIIAIKVF
ncbi:MAG: VTT domain-containing protein [Bacteroidota bacterium]